MKSKNFQTWCADFERRYAGLAPAGSIPANSTFYVTSALDHTRASAQERRVEAILSSTNPVARWDHDQVLLHSPEAVDLHRLIDGGLPLLFSHDPYQIIGRAENVRVYEGTLRANLRFSTSAKGEEVWQDVLDGIATGISIGFNVTSSEFNEDSQVQTITRWTPLEASVVAMPADMTARIERSLELGVYRERPAEVKAIHYQRQLLDSYRAGIVELAGRRGITESRDHAGVLADIQQQIMDAKTEGDLESCRELIRRTAFDYMAAQDSNANILTIRTTDAFGQPYAPGIITSRGTNMENFSLCRAIAMQFDPAAARAGGPELEIMQDAARRRGTRSGEHYTLPEEALFTRAVTKGGTGGNLIGVEHMGAMFVPALRERLITGRMGAMILPGLTGDIQIPKQLTDSAAGWIAGDGSDQVSASDPTYAKITMSPKTVGVKSTLSRKMIIQGDPASEVLLRNTLAFAVAKAIDSAALIGDGTGNKPVGILETADIGTDTYTTGGLPSFGEIVDLEGMLMIDDADTGNLGYVTTGLMASKLKQKEVVATTGQMIWTSTAEAEGRMNGYRAVASNIVPAGHIIFGNWADLIIGMWSGYDFTVDPYTRAAYGDVIINLLLDCDVAVRHGESFAELHEA
jgi:HK97 family phage major capsid protein/HK97 family phage prohead protease